MKAIEFEKLYGTTQLLKTIITSIDNVLISKGLVTEQDLLRSFDFESALFITSETSRLINEKESLTGRLVNLLEKMLADKTSYEWMAFHHIHEAENLIKEFKKGESK